MKIQKLNDPALPKRTISESRPSRLWFQGHGFRQVPPELVDNKILWAHEKDMRFLNQYGKQVVHDFSPSMRDKSYAHGHGEPKLRSYGNKRCRIIMAVTFYGERPVYKDKHGKPYVGIAHHLINDLTDYRKDNLLCWLTREQHGKADARRRALEAIVPDGNLHALPYARLRELQDPRTMSDDTFAHELEAIKAHFTTMDKVDPQERIDREMSRHTEF